jgi:cytosine/adenosine deaminase-related metal-dependent hydrolase
VTQTPFAPGFVNAHTHLYSGLVPLGMPALVPPPRAFPEILSRLWWRLDRALDARSLRASARYYVAHALLTGTTTLIDHHESPGFIEGSLDVLADACTDLGARALLCYGASERNGGRDEAKRGLAECARFARKRLGSTLRGMVGLHASFTVSDESIREAGQLCRELRTTLHIHVAEDLCDLEDARRRGYEGPLERLIEQGALVPGSIVAHGVHLSASAVTRCETLGVWLVQSPRSNEANGVGYPGALAQSRLVALGTDGFPADMLAEAAVLGEVGTARGDDARAFNQRLDAGRVLAVQHFGAAAIERDLVRRAGGCVRDVVVDGREVVRDGMLLTADVMAIEAEAREAAPDLWRRMSELAPT